MSIDPLALRGVLEHIETHTEEWDQSYWAKKTGCGTSFCFAGWTVVLAGLGDEIQWYEDGKWYEDGNLKRAETLKDGSTISDTAAMILGLDFDAATRLFYGTNTLDQVRQKVNDLCAGV